VTIWTDADQAELDLLVHELVTAEFLHRERCETCLIGIPCAPLRRAVEAVVWWRHGRMLRSRAAWLREQLEDEQAAA
jgi:hypothetical protein